MKCTQCVGLAAAALMVLLTGSAPAQADHDAIITGGSFEYNRKYRIGPHLKFQVTDHTSGDHFEALVGPLPNAGVGSYTVFEAIKDLTGADEEINMAISGQDGFVYMDGVQPYGGTDGGSTTGEGTSMIVQRITIDSTIYHRFFRLVADDNVNVYDVEEPPNTVALVANYTYVQRTNGPLSARPIAIPTDPNDPIYRFVVDVLGLAASAGMTVPGPPT